MDNEMLTTRLRLLPVRLPPDDYADYELLICDPDDRSAPFENSGDGDVYYTSSQLVVLRQGVAVDAGGVIPPDFIIDQLKPRQRLKTSFRLAYRSPKGSDATNRDYAWQSVWIDRWEYKTKRPIVVADDETDYIGRETKTPRHYVIKLSTSGYFHATAVRTVAGTRSPPATGNKNRDARCAFSCCS
jgi:hypothetical protein